MPESDKVIDLTELTLFFEGLSQSEEIRKNMHPKDVWRFREMCLNLSKNVEKANNSEEREEVFFKGLAKITKFTSEDVKINPALAAKHKESTEKKLKKVAEMLKSVEKDDMPALIDSLSNYNQKLYDQIWEKVDVKLKEAGFREASLKMQTSALEKQASEKSFVAKVQIERGII